MNGLLGDMGGIFGLLISLMSYIFTPISRHSFNIKAARKLFIARSANKGLFEEVPSELKGMEFNDKLSKS